VVVDGRPHLDLFDLDDLLPFARFGRFLLLFVFVFPVVHKLDYGRLRSRRYFDKVEASFLRYGEGLVDADLAELLAFRSDEQDGARFDFFVDARPVLGRRRRCRNFLNSYGKLPSKGPTRIRSRKS
jgi:hypothetical protein